MGDLGTMRDYGVQEGSNIKLIVKSKGRADVKTTVMKTESAFFTAQLMFKMVHELNHYFMNEDLTKVDRRIWRDPFRSKLASAILGGLEIVTSVRCAKVLNIGAASRTTVSDVFDSVAVSHAKVLNIGAASGITLPDVFDSANPTGVVYAVEISHRTGPDLVNKSKMCINVVVEDTRRSTAKYVIVVGMVDVTLSDLAQPDKGLGLQVREDSGSSVSKIAGRISVLQAYSADACSTRCSSVIAFLCGKCWKGHNLKGLGLQAREDSGSSISKIAGRISVLQAYSADACSTCGSSVIAFLSGKCWKGHNLMVSWELLTPTYSIKGLGLKVREDYGSSVSKLAGRISVLEAYSADAYATCCSSVMAFLSGKCWKGHNLKVSWELLTPTNSSETSSLTELLIETLIRGFTVSYKFAGDVSAHDEISDTEFQTEA